jgi:uncharacterized membrane protein
MTTLTTSLHRQFLKRSEIERLLVASTVFSCTLVLLRVFRAHSTIFMFMIWNLFLAYIPYALSTWLTARKNRSGNPQSSQKPILNIAIATAWLLFIPNTFYILTDLFHLVDRQHPRIPEWFDLILIFSFAWNGLLLGILSVRQMEKLLPGKNELRNNVFIISIMALSALGVYTGRYLRYNSWDVLSNPFHLTADMLDMIAHPLHYGQAWSMIVCYTILLTFIYTMLKKLSTALS